MNVTMTNTEFKHLKIGDIVRLNGVNILHIVINIFENDIYTEQFDEYMSMLNKQRITYITSYQDIEIVKKQNKENIFKSIYNKFIKLFN